MTDKLHEQAEKFIDIMPRLVRRLYSLEGDEPAMELPVAQMRVCTILRDGPQSMSAISRELGITHSAMTQIADRLERQQMVERVCETEDRRVKCLQLTEYGHQLMRRRRERRLASVVKAMERLSPGEREALIASVTTFFDAVRDNPAQTCENQAAIQQLEMM